MVLGCLVAFVVFVFFTFTKMTTREGAGGKVGGGGSHGGGGGGTAAVAASGGGGGSGSHSSNATPASSGGRGGGGGGGNKGPGCFSAGSLVKLENNVIKNIEDLRLGDKILSYSEKSKQFVYSPIIAIPHEKNNQLSAFVELVTSSNKKIALTEDHLLPIVHKDTTTMLTAAKNIEIGDNVTTVDGDESIVSKNIVDKEGVYTIVTMEDYVVVDGVVASPFYLNFHVLGNIYYSLPRFLCRINENAITSPIYEKYNKTSHELFINILKMIK